MKKIFITLLSLAILLAMLVQPGLAAGTASTITLSQVQQPGAELTMYVTLTDSNGNPVTGDYTADEFIISIDDETLDVDSVEVFDSETEGIHYVFSVDVSKSLTTAMMTQVKQGLSTFVSNFGPLDTATIITFGEDVVVRLSNSGDEEEILSVIDSLEADEGMTALYKGVIDAVTAAASTSGRSVVIMITDGKNDPTDEMSSYTLDSIYDSVTAAQVPVYCIGLNDNNGVDSESLQSITEATGGKQYDIASSECETAMENIREIVCSAITLKATLVNTEGRTGFTTQSTFQVGFQPTDGTFLTSNELVQNINWNAVPSPTATPSPEPTATPIPEIELELDQETISYTGGTQSIRGFVSVVQGTVDASDLTFYVNDELWEISSISINGDGYTFSISGVIPEGTETLIVEVRIESIGVVSRSAYIDVITSSTSTPTPTDTPTPESVSLELNDVSTVVSNGDTITIRGTIVTTGSVDMDAMELLVNGTSCEYALDNIGSGQYQFTVEYTIEDVSMGVDVQVKLSDINIYSITQTLVLPTATPTVAPELTIALKISSVEAAVGESVTISGTIESTSSEITADDIYVAVNNQDIGADITSDGDGLFSFTAQYTLEEEDETQLLVRAVLKESAGIKSDVAELPVVIVTPVPTRLSSDATLPPSTEETTEETTEEPTAEPTAEATEVLTEETTAEPTAEATEVLTEETTAEPTEEPAVEPTEAPTNILSALVEKVPVLAPLQQKGILLPVLIAVVVLLIVLIVLIVLLCSRKKPEPYDTGRSNRMPDDSNEMAMTRDEGKTEGTNTTPSVSSTSDGETIPMDQEWEFGGTIADPENTGTIPEVPTIRVTLRPIYNNRPMAPIDFEMRQDEECTIGRAADNAIRFEDGKVSGHHASLSYDGTDVKITDTHSTNHTYLNGRLLRDHQPTVLKNGDRVRLASAVEFTVTITE